MVEVKVTLDFACCACDHSVSVTVKCTGKGLTAFATADILVFEVRVVDGDIEVKQTAAGASA